MSDNEEEGAEDVMSEALAASLWSDERSWITQRNWDASGGIAVRLHIRAILAALKANGYAVVELPKPKYREPHGYGYSNENAHLSDWGVFACIEDGCVYDQNDGLSPEDAWTIGSWWLAASRCITEREVAAERDSEGGE